MKIYLRIQYSVKSNQQSSIETQYRRFDQIVNGINFKKNQVYWISGVELVLFLTI